MKLLAVTVETQLELMTLLAFHIRQLGLSKFHGFRTYPDMFYLDFHHGS